MVGTLTLQVSEASNRKGESNKMVCIVPPNHGGAAEHHGHDQMSAQYEDHPHIRIFPDWKSNKGYQILCTIIIGATAISAVQIHDIQNIMMYIRYYLGQQPLLLQKAARKFGP